MLAFLVPTRNRHAELPRTLASLTRAARRVDARILLCDQSPAAFAQPGPWQVLHEPFLSGLPAARNLLLRSTDADIVCFCDDDVDLGADFAERLLAHAAAEPEVVGWGPIVELRPRRVRRLHRLAQLGAFRDPRRLLGSRSDRATRALFGCCFAVRRARACAVGFDERREGYALGEDLDFFLRLGGPYRFCRDLRCVHRQAGGGRADSDARGLAKGAFLRWLARRHGGRNPATPLHLALASLAAASGAGRERARWRPVLAGLLDR